MVNNYNGLCSDDSYRYPIRAHSSVARGSLVYSEGFGLVWFGFFLVWFGFGFYYFSSLPQQYELQISAGTNKNRKVKGPSCAPVLVVTVEYFFRLSPFQHPQQLNNVNNNYYDWSK